MRCTGVLPWLVVTALLAGTVRAQEVGAAPSAPMVRQGVGGISPGQPAPLEIWNREVVVLRADLGRLTTAQRVEQAARRVLDLPEASRSAPVDVDPVEFGSLVGFNFSVDGRFLFTVFEQDVDTAAGVTLAQTVERTRASLGEVLAAQVSQRSLWQVLTSIGLTLAATLALIGALWLVALIKRDLIRRFRVRVAHSERLRVRTVDLRPYVAEAFERLVGIANLLAIGALLYLWLGFCLARFPYTAPWSDALATYVSDLARWLFHSIAGAVPDLVLVAIIFFVTRGVARTIKLVVTRIERRAERVEGVAPETIRATRRLAIVIVWIFGVVLAYPHLPGAQTDAFKGVSVLLGLMVSLGSAGFVNQVMSGFVVLYSRSVRSGEVVRIGDIEGQVTDLGLLSTKILRPSGEEVSIPNAVVVTQATTNFSRGSDVGGAVASTTVTIGYDTPWRQVRALLLLAAKRTEGIAGEPAPRVEQRALADWYVEYALILQVEDAKLRAAVMSRLRAAIQDAFNEFGVQIMSPHFNMQPDGKVVVSRGAEEPDPAPRFRFAKEAPPASFDPVEKAAQERAERAAEEKAKAERVRLRAEREAAAEHDPSEPSGDASAGDGGDGTEKES